MPGRKRKNASTKKRQIRKRKSQNLSRKVKKQKIRKVQGSKTRNASGKDKKRKSLKSRAKNVSEELKNREISELGSENPRSKHFYEVVSESCEMKIIWEDDWGKQVEVPDTVVETHTLGRFQTLEKANEFAKKIFKEAHNSILFLLEAFV